MQARAVQLQAAYTADARALLTRCRYFAEIGGCVHTLVLVLLVDSIEGKEACHASGQVLQVLVARDLPA